MKSKFLLFAIVALAITSCSTAYKSGQTPDDVYYSPARFEENKDDDNKDDKQDQVNQTAEDRRVRQTIRDRRWRDLDEYDYTYNNSPYNHCYCNCTNYGYYYNPYYNSAPIYSTTTIKNTTPRKINLSSYQGYNTVKIATTKNNTYNAGISTPKYNNSNKKQSLGSKIIKVFTSKETNPTNTETNSSSGSSNTKTYSPSSTNTTSSSSSSKSSSGTSVSRPSRGGQ
jgi:hypothetical protein